MGLADIVTSAMISSGWRHVGGSSGVGGAVCVKTRVTTIYLARSFLQQKRYCVSRYNGSVQVHTFRSHLLACLSSHTIVSTKQDERGLIYGHIAILNHTSMTHSSWCPRPQKYVLPIAYYYFTSYYATSYNTYNDNYITLQWKRSRAHIPFSTICLTMFPCNPVDKTGWTWTHLWSHSDLKSHFNGTQWLVPATAKIRTPESVLLLCISLSCITVRSVTYTRCSA